MEKVLLNMDSLRKEYLNHNDILRDYITYV